MAITDQSSLINALANGGQPFTITKASLVTQIAGGFCSMWRSAGTPPQGAIPTAAAVCVKGLVGGFLWDNPTVGKNTHLARLMSVSSNSATDMQLHDRLAHMGGLVGNVITSQTVSVDVSGTGDNMVARRGSADYGDVQWWLEWYTTTGATASVATVTYTNGDGTSGRTTTVALAASIGASRRLPIQGTGSDKIQSIQSVQLSVSTATAGNFGVTATRSIASNTMLLANSSAVANYIDLALAKIENDACIEIVILPGTTNSGTLYGSAKIIQG